MSVNSKVPIPLTLDFFNSLDRLCEAAERLLRPFVDVPTASRLPP